MIVFYLKINQNTQSSLLYLNQWLDFTKQVPNSKIYIICDNDALTKNVRKELGHALNNCTFMESQRDSSELQYISQNVADDRWKLAALAHLTTFYHSRNEGYDSFWNIDADDIGLYMEPVHFVEIITKIQTFASEKKYDMFSLDLWRTIERGRHWSYGVTYVRNSIDFIEIMKKHCMDPEYNNKYKSVASGRNIDWFSTYLESISTLTISTFYIENLRIIHHTNDVYRYPLFGLRYWRNQKCYFPTIYNDFGMKELGMLKIPKDIIPFDFGISEQESLDYLIKMSKIPPFVLENKRLQAEQMEISISIIIPMYNAEEYIATCLDNLLLQKVQNFEIIMIDDHSTDRTLDICRSMVEQLGDRASIIFHEKVQGLIPSLNEGLRLASGKYIIFLNGKDIFLEDGLEKLYQISEKERADLIYTGVYAVEMSAGNKENLTIISTEQNWPKELNSLFFIQDETDRLVGFTKHMFSISIYNKLIRRNFLEKHNLSFMDETFMWEWMFCFMCLCLSHKYLRISYPLYKSQNNFSRCNIKNDEYKNVLEKILNGENFLDNFMKGIRIFEEKFQLSTDIKNNYINCCLAKLKDIPIENQEKFILGYANKHAKVHLGFLASILYRITKSNTYEESIFLNDIDR